MSARLRIVAAVICLTAGLASALLGTDLLRWRSGMRAGDTRFASGSLAGDLWTPQQFLPLGAARAALGLDDDLVYRHAVRAFVLGRPREVPYSDTDVLIKRVQAQELLEGIVDSRADSSRKAEAANLIGVLGFANSAIDPNQAYNYLKEAITSFRQSIALDPENPDAKYNLELALERFRKTRPPAGQQPKQRDTRGGSGSGAGTGEPGSGY